jgi:hypothetical protein
VVAGAGTALVVFFSLLVFVFPHEWVEPAAKFLRVADLVFSDEINDVRGAPVGWFANRIVVSDQDFVDDEMLLELRKREEDQSLEPRAVSDQIASYPASYPAAVK